MNRERRQFTWYYVRLAIKYHFIANMPYNWPVTDPLYSFFLKTFYPILITDWRCGP